MERKGKIGDVSKFIGEAFIAVSSTLSLTLGIRAESWIVFLSILPIGIIVGILYILLGNISNKMDDTAKNTAEINAKLWKILERMKEKDAVEKSEPVALAKSEEVHNAEKIKPQQKIIPVNDMGALLEALKADIDQFNTATEILKYLEKYNSEYNYCIPEDFMQEVSNIAKNERIYGNLKKDIIFKFNKYIQSI